MPDGNRTGPMGHGSKTGRSLGYCTGNDFPGYTKGVPSGAGREFGEHKSGRRNSGYGGGRGTGCVRKGRGFRCRSAPEFVSSGEFAARGTYPGYYYSASSQSQTGSEVDSLENRIKLLKQEFETLGGKLKTLRLQGSSVEE